jgi:hypothetical protein
LRLEKTGGKMKKIVMVAVAVVSLGVAGCTIKRPMLVSSTSMGPGQEEVVGMAAGDARQAWFLGFPLSDSIDYSFQAALKNAVNGKADTLINVFADESCFYIPFPLLALYHDCEIRLTGTAIRYKALTPQTAVKLAASAPATSAKPEPGLLRQLFEGMKQGQHVRLTMPDAPPTEYIFLQYYPRDSSVGVKPLGGGWFSEQSYYLQYILAAEPVESDIAPLGGHSDKGSREKPGLPGYSVTTTSPTISAEPHK